MFVEDSGKSENVCPDVVSNDTTPAFKDFQSLEKGELFCLNEEDNESDDISPDYSKKKTEIINYFNVFCPQLSAYSYNNITKQLSFSEQFFLLSSYRQILLQVIMI
jgi:hypothetical protein